MNNLKVVSGRASTLKYVHVGLG